MNQEFFINLPSELVIDILSRLPVRTIISCKCVCKSWLDLVESLAFAKCHLSKSVPGLTVFQPEMPSASYKIFEFEDRLDLEHHELHYNPVMKFDFPHANSVIIGSASGLLFLLNPCPRPNGLYICNPITHEYIKLRSQESVCEYPKVVAYGFGASKITGQHKVVSISQDCRHDQGTGELLEVTKSECQVYTLGTRSWRRIAPDDLLWYGGHSIGAFLNGNLHWLVFDLNGCPWISCFDLETELFSTFSSPPFLGRKGFLVSVSVLGDCLCLSDNQSYDDEIVIWVMKEYGVEKSWTKEFVISKILHPSGRFYGVGYPIKVFKDGDILMSCGFFVFYYSKKNKTTQRIEMFEVGSAGCVNAIVHASSFFSLKSFAMENVNSF